jgi:dihydroflavonol-4-reductase
MRTGEHWLVTGGTGFIGRFVVRVLLRRGVPVRLLCRDAAKARGLFGEQVSVVTGDLRDPLACQRACCGVTTVIHLGGQYRFGRRHRAELAATNTGGTENLLAAAWHQRVTKFVHVSSAGVLEPAAATISEQDFPARVPGREFYRHSKWRAECAALDWARRGLPVVIASPTVPLGPEDEAPTPSGQMVADFLKRRFPFSAHTTINLVHIAELADGLVAVADRGRVRERYLLGHHNLSLDEFLRLLAACTGQTAPGFSLPAGFIMLAGTVGELIGADRLCWETAQHARRRVSYSSRKAADELDWRPNCPAGETVREAVAWFGQQRAAPVSAGNFSVKPDVAS